MEIGDVIKLIILIGGIVLYGFLEYTRGYTKGAEDKKFEETLRAELLRDAERKMIGEKNIPIEYIKEVIEDASGPERTYLERLLTRWEKRRKTY